MALMDADIGTGRKTTNTNKTATSQNTPSKKPTSSHTVNNIPVSNPSTGNSYADALRQASINGTRINGAFNVGTTKPNPVTGTNTTVTGNTWNTWKKWEDANPNINNDVKQKVRTAIGYKEPAVLPVSTAPAVQPVVPSVQPKSEPEVVPDVPKKSEPVKEAEKQVDNTLELIKGYLEDQKAQADAYYKTQYESALANNRQQWEADRNQANLNYKRTDRYLNSLYGDQYSGAGLSNKTRNTINWNNNLANIQRDYAQRDYSSLADYNKNLSDTASKLNQGWYNYVLPIYTNRLSNAENMDYQTWAYEKQLENNRLKNQDDLNYRLQLAMMGLL